MKKLLALICLLASTASHATNQTGTVKYVQVRADGLVIFEIVGSTKSLVPGCGTTAYWLINDQNSNAGKQQYAMLLMAQATGKVVNVVGLNECDRWGDGEDVNYIQVND